MGSRFPGPGGSAAAAHRKWRGQFPGGSVAGRAAGATMVLLTMIARVADGLLLAASMQEDEQVGQAGRGRGGPGVSVRSWRGATRREPRSPFSQQRGSDPNVCLPVVAVGAGRASRCCWAPVCLRYRPSSLFSCLLSQAATCSSTRPRRSSSSAS